MPNVGKSTLFNALTNTQAAQAANYPFCTIDPNVGKVAIPDMRLEKLAKVAASAKIIGAQLEFVDIAGLVKGASEGAGLGNKFLSHIRQVSMIVQLVRCFDDSSREIITHVDGSVDPVRDIETIETELLLADIQTLSKKDGNSKKSANEQELAARILKDLDKGIPARKFILQPEEVASFRNFSLLTGKPMLIVCNVPDSQLSGNKYTEAVQQLLQKRKSEDPEYVEEQGDVINVCSKLEEEVSLMDDPESREQILQEYGLEKTGLSKIVAESNRRLGLQTYYTVGPQEARAWQFPEGMLAPQAAGIIHTDFEKGFIKAETISYDDYIACGGEQGAKEAGKLRLEGKEYVCQDGDIFHFKFNV
ncbi:hypothetical protein GUITHDRAFT_157221 [Guillardia theta CCMP2712]|uniref:Obg-like ATPase homolog n=1 Tax=Guillardia theta (strain CCMP2712) TaxID=905079 RepID=L1JRW0_GUITC|nr:hypothetical protein GUITHDRAFT_157221 [Guillardia theta CCMP2712]EKX51192.1 hypothetical protein GUITHDRAFT_157221 [Guillardia theta CCMP2712]|eukprot:XP_005838172.1 hypothetical protein GUITHDRAFT_157221 [Guillardia theta CCMP2712]